MNREVIQTDAVPSSGKPYSQAISSGGLVFVSGQVALDPAGGPVAGGIEPQARRVLSNLRLVLEAAGSSLDLVLKTTCFLTDGADAPRFNELYREYFPSDQPARSTVVVAGLSPGFVVEVEAVAAVRDPTL